MCCFLFAILSVLHYDVRGGRRHHKRKNFAAANATAKAEMLAWVQSVV